MAKSSEGGVWDQDLLGSERTGLTILKQASKIPEVNVRDDWDEEDDDDGEEQKEHERPSGTRNDGQGPGPDPSGRRKGLVEVRNEDNTEIWEEANRRAPMPELVVAPASTGPGLSPPPPAALQPTLRILKRPSPNASGNNAGGLSSFSPSSSPGHFSGSGSGGSSPAPRSTLAEREAQYQEARSRIFGGKEKSASTSGNASLTSMSRTSSSSGGVVVVRDPLGPACEPELGALAGRDTDRSSRLPKGFGEKRRGKK